MPRHFHRGFLKYHLLGLLSSEDSMVTPPWPTSSSIVGCFPSTSIRSSFAFFNLKIVGNDKETVEQFKKNKDFTY